MATHIDAEPVPKAAPDAWAPVQLEVAAAIPLPSRILAPVTDFFAAVHSRRSGVGSDPDHEKLGSLLWHTTQLRERRFDRRFKVWESRTSPSAGGLHPISLLVLPMLRTSPAGIYSSEAHEVRSLAVDATPALNLNANSVRALCNASAGTTIQLIADSSKLASCYDNYHSLLWRDAGALIATLTFIATALELTSVPLGRHGTDIIRALGLSAPLVGAGAIHIGDV
jgi:SagB-type dehydrogenase family enzyme